MRSVCTFIYVTTVPFSSAFSISLSLSLSRVEPCKKIAPAFQRLSEKFTNAVFIMLDVEICRVRTDCSAEDVLTGNVSCGMMECVCPE